MLGIKPRAACLLIKHHYQYREDKTKVGYKARLLRRIATTAEDPDFSVLIFNHFIFILSWIFKNSIHSINFHKGIVKSIFAYSFSPSFSPFPAQSSLCMSYHCLLFTFRVLNIYKFCIHRLMSTLDKWCLTISFL